MGYELIELYASPHPKVLEWEGGPRGMTLFVSIFNFNESNNRILSKLLFLTCEYVIISITNITSLDLSLC